MVTGYAKVHRVTRSFDVDKQSGSPLVHKTYHSKAYSLCGFENPYPKIPLSIFGGRTEDLKVNIIAYGCQEKFYIRGRMEEVKRGRGNAQAHWHYRLSREEVARPGVALRLSDYWRGTAAFVTSTTAHDNPRDSSVSVDITSIQSHV
jgi:hypothetical protein